MASPTRLETFIRSRGIKPAHLAKVSGYSRQHLLRIRMGRMDPTRRCMAATLCWEYNQIPGASSINCWNTARQPYIDACRVAAPISIRTTLARARRFAGTPSRGP